MGEFETVMQTRDEGGQKWTPPPPIQTLLKTCQRPGPTIKMKNARQMPGRGGGGVGGMDTLGIA